MSPRPFISYTLVDFSLKTLSTASNVHPLAGLLQFHHPKKLQPERTTFNQKQSDSGLQIMSSYRNEGMSEHSMPSDISSFSKGKRTTPQASISFSDPLRALPPPPPPIQVHVRLPVPSPVACLLLKEKHPAGWSTKYRNHTQSNYNPNPNNAHKVNQADRVGMIDLVEDNNAEEGRKSRAAEFGSHARNTGITEERFVAQKVAIWEWMWVAKQTGDNIGVGTPYPVPL
ncbi:hypothetical protein B9Z19DRAFT_1061049 [Tuber borchii]|uniref:Uncharacterized protein n=1 Tax=Tuber borchii TaxID=42251 RepID=A0A2T7A6I5_TUBBO|nr:hypothetical protein B9Z19DRAFT_1061049 [Tuber borchii]